MTNQTPRHTTIRGECTFCRTPAPCSAVALQASGHWHDLADAFDSLHAYLQPQGTTTSTVHMPPGSRPPISVTVSDLLFDIAEAASFYALAMQDDTNGHYDKDHKPHGYIAPQRTDVKQRLRDIATRYGHFTTDTNARWVTDGGYWQRVAMDFCDTAYTLRERAIHVVQQPLPPQYLGPCMAGNDCKGDVYLTSTDKMPRCTTCDTGHDTTQLRDQMTKALAGRLLSREDLRHALNLLREPHSKKVTPERVRQWIKRRRLVPIIKAPELFRLTDAMELAGITIDQERRVS